ncbi:MAG: hypothetical protein ACXWNN_07100 [Candidatus Binataceae bacterium]
MPDKASASRIARSVRQRHKFTFTAHRWRKERRFQNGEIVLQRTKLALMVPRLAESRTRSLIFLLALHAEVWCHRGHRMYQLAALPGIIAASPRGPVAAGLGFGAGPREFCSALPALVTLAIQDGPALA